MENKDKNQGNQTSSNRSGNQGFAGMDKEKQREIASKGGQASHKNDNKSGSESEDKKGQK